MSQISLKTLLVPSKETEVEFPGMPDFKVKVAFLSRETLQKLRKKATNIAYKNHQPVETVDDDLFLKLYVESSVKGWTGLKLRYLQQLAPIDLGDNDPEIELEFTNEEALGLMKSSVQFDNFISQQVSDLGNFNANK